MKKELDLNCDIEIGPRRGGRSRGKGTADRLSARLFGDGDLGGSHHIEAIGGLGFELALDPVDTLVFGNWIEV